MFCKLQKLLSFLSTFLSIIFNSKDKCTTTQKNDELITSIYLKEVLYQTSVDLLIHFNSVNIIKRKLCSLIINFRALPKSAYKPVLSNIYIFFYLCRNTLKNMMSKHDVNIAEIQKALANQIHTRYCIILFYHNIYCLVHTFSNTRFNETTHYAVYQFIHFLQPLTKL